MEEIWKKVRGFEDWAEISNMGQIHRFRREWYTGRGHKTKRIQEEDWTYGSPCRGYLQTSIGGKSFRVNRLVYMTFVGEIPDGLQVNHLDEDKHNNCVWNLNLMTPKENTNWGTGNARRAASNRGQKRSEETKAKISAAHRGMKQSEETKAKIGDAHRGKYNTKCCKPVQALDKDGNVVYEFPSGAEAKRQGFDAGAVSACCLGKRKTAYGLIWRFKENKSV